MTEHELDLLRDQMIAALYGELSPQEAAEVESRIRASEELLAEWNELQEARAFLRAAADEEPADEFVCAMPARGRERIERRPRRAPSGWPFLRAFLPGFALAAAAMLILIATGFRADRVDGALVLRFAPAGSTPAQPRLTGNYPGGALLETRSSSVSPAESFERAPELAPLAQSVDARDAHPPAGESQALDPDRYLTRDDFALYARGMNALVEQLVGNQEDRGRAEMVYLTRALYEEITRRQNERYDQLDARIQQVWLGMAGMRREGVEIVPRGDETENSRPRIVPTGRAR